MDTMESGGCLTDQLQPVHSYARSTSFHFSGTCGVNLEEGGTHPEETQDATHCIMNEFTQWTGHHAYITTQPLCRSTTSSNGQVSQHKLAEYLLSHMRICIGARSGAHLVVHFCPVNPTLSTIETSLRPSTSGTFGSYWGDSNLMFSQLELTKS